MTRLRTLTGVFFLIGLTLSPGVNAQTPSSEAAHQQFVFAYRLLQRGEDKLAAKAFDQYLGRFPRDEKVGDALYYRALLARKDGDSALAGKLLDQAVTTKIVPDYALNLLRGQVNIDLKKYEAALASLEKVHLENLEPTIVASARYMQGVAYRGANNPAAAAEHLAQVAKIDSPLKARALLDLARIHVQMQKPGEALAALEECLTLNDNAVSPEAARLAGDLNYKANQFEEADRFYRVVLTRYQSSPHFGPAVVGIMWAQLSAKQYKTVLNTFEQYKDALPVADRQTAWYLAGSAHYELGEHEEAVKLLEPVLPGVAGTDLEEKVLFKLAAGLFELGRHDQMNKTLDELKEKYPKSPFNADADFLRAGSDARQGDATTAAGRLSTIITEGPTHPYYAKALLQRAKLYERSQKLEAAEADYDRYVKAVEAAGASGGEPEPEMLQATLRLIDLRYRLAKYESAEQSAAQLLARPKLDALTEQEALYRRALALVQLQKFQPAYETFQTLLTKHPQNRYEGEAHYYRGLLAMSMNRSDAAVDDLIAAAKSGGLSQSLEANAWRLAAIRLCEKDRNDEAAAALASLQKIIGLARLTPTEQIWLGQYHVDHGQPVEALKYLEPVIKGGPSIPGPTRAHAYLLTAQSLRDAGKLEPAILSLRQVVAMDSGYGLEARLQLAKTLTQADQLDAALEEYQGLISAKPSAIAAEALYDSALIYRRQATARNLASDPAGAAEANRQAFANLKRLVVLYSFPQLSPLPQIAHIELAEVADDLDRPAEASNAMRELADKYPNTPYASFAQAMLAIQQNKRSEAVQRLKMLRDQDPAPPLAKRVRALLLTLEAAP